MKQEPGGAGPGSSYQFSFDAGTEINKYPSVGLHQPA